MPEPAFTRLQADDRRRRLIDAGSALFAQHAFEEISMRQIAEAAGVSKPLLYHYFPSKNDLFIAAVTEAASDRQQLLDRRPVPARAADVEPRRISGLDRAARGHLGEADA